MMQRRKEKDIMSKWQYAYIVFSVLLALAALVVSIYSLVMRL